jgi:hypothetical protein
MHVQEKQAWFTLVVGLATVIVFGVVFALCKIFGHPPTVAFASFALFALTGFEGHIGRREKKTGKVTMDERDLEIARAALLAAYSVFWVLFVLAAVGPMFIFGNDAKITIDVSDIAMVCFPAMLVVFTVRALVTIILYKKGAGHE